MERHLVVDTSGVAKIVLLELQQYFNGTPSKLIAVVVVEDACQSWEVAYYNRWGRQVDVGAVFKSWDQYLVGCSRSALLSIQEPNVISWQH